MQNVANLLSKEFVQAQSPERQETARPLTATAARTLWVRMAEIYGHRWTSAYGDSSEQDGAAGTWAKGLAGLTVEHIAVGLKACIVSSEPWPPTLPEFRAMCLSIPSMATVKADTSKDSEFSRLVWSKINAWDYRHADGDKAHRMIRDAYSIAREVVMREGAIPESRQLRGERAQAVMLCIKEHGIDEAELMVKGK